MKRILTLLAASALLSGCGGKKENELKISGGTAHLKVMNVVAKKFRETHPDVNITISGGGSGVGIKQVGEGMVDIGNSGRDLKESEISKYGLVPHAIAIDAISVIVNPSSKINKLTSEQVQKIYSGAVSNWKALGGTDAKINVYTRDSESGTRSTFWKLALKKGKITNSAMIVKSNGDMKVNIARDKFGIGFMSVGNMDKSVKAVAVDGILPTVENIKSGKYRIQRKLYSVTKGEPKGIVKEFIDLLTSDYGQKVVQEHKFIPVK